MDFLSEIVARRRQRVEEAQRRVSLDYLVSAANARNQARRKALRTAVSVSGRINIIAEFKRRSPSKGLIRADVNPKTVTRSYQAGGAIGVSVLTEEDYFDGSLEDLRTVKAAVELPVLRKDFIFGAYQVYEAAAAGADAILLIAAVLDDEALRQLRKLAEDELGMDALVEVHDGNEMERAAACGATLIGVNNRNLRTFDVSLETSISLAGAAPSDAVLISESGLHSRADLQRLGDAGYRGFLIGESLMRADQPDEVLRSLIGP